MKTIKSIRQYFPVLTISLFLIASTINVNAQNRRTEKKNKENNKTEYRKPDRNDSRVAKNSKMGNHEGSYDKKDYKNSKSNLVYRPQYTRNFKHSQPNYFNHPKFGRVYLQFDHNPVVFKHNRDNYYYFGNQFYTYRRGVGYCLVEAPRSLYFRHLPVECNRVNVNGHVFFQNGELFFRLSPWGYTIVPSPIELRFSARF